MNSVYMHTSYILMIYAAISGHDQEESAYTEYSLNCSSWGIRIGSDHFLKPAILNNLCKNYKWIKYWTHRDYQLTQLNATRIKAHSLFPPIMKFFRTYQELSLWSAKSMCGFDLLFGHFHGISNTIKRQVYGRDYKKMRRSCNAMTSI